LAVIAAAHVPVCPRILRRWRVAVLGAAPNRIPRGRRQDLGLELRKAGAPLGTLLLLLRLRMLVLAPGVLRVLLLRLLLLLLLIGFGNDANAPSACQVGPRGRVFVAALCIEHGRGCVV
jgi:hypothetical protein